MYNSRMFSMQCVASYSQITVLLLKVLLLLSVVVFLIKKNWHLSKPRSKNVSVRDEEGRKALHLRVFLFVCLFLYVWKYY